MLRLRQGRGFSGDGEEIRRTGEVVGGVAVGGVAEICGQQGQQRLNVGALLMPEAEPGRGEPMPEIVRSQASAVIETGELTDFCESASQTRCRQAVASGAEKEGPVLGPGKRGVALTGIKTKGSLGRGVDRDEAVLAEFCVPNVKNAVGQIHVSAIKPDRFARSQP